MKNVTLITLIIIFTALTGNLSAQCTPDPNGPTRDGIYPNDSLPDGTAGVMYDEIIQLVLPRDTSVDLGIAQLDASFCSFKLDTIRELPAGISYECNVPGCEWDIDHTPGVVNRGCVRIFGTTAYRIPDDSLRATITITPGVYDSTALFCDTDSLRTLAGPFWTLVQSFLTQETAIQLHIDGGLGVGIEEKLVREAVGLTVYPNPLEENGFVKFELAERTDVTLDVVDQMGRIVQHIETGSANPGENRYEISHTGLSSGLYLIRLQLDGGKYVVTEKMTVR